MKKYLFLIFFGFHQMIHGQTGTWKTHADYALAKGIEMVKNKVYCFTENGFFCLNKTDNEVVKFSKKDNFSEIKIAQIRYSSLHQKLLIAYESGGLDLVSISSEGLPEKIQTIYFIKNNTTIQGSKNINQIEFQQDFAYLASDFGLVVFDLKKNEIKETYQNLGENGKALAIKKIAFAQDSIFLNTPLGIIGAKFSENNNLQYYGNWTKIAQSKLFQKPIYPKDNLVLSPNEIEIDEQGKTWIADGINGLLGNEEGIFKKYSPNGIQGEVFQLFFENQKIYAVGTNTQILDENEWKIIENPPILSKKLTDKFGNIWQSNNFGVVVRSANNQTKTFRTGKNNGNLPSTNINCISEDREGLIWIGTDNGVAVIVNSEDIFTRNTDAYQPIYEGRRLFLQENVNAIAIDGGNRKWFATPRGISLFDANVDELLLNFTTENSPIPSNEVYDIAIDSPSGEIFFATDNGVISYQSDASEPSNDYAHVKIFPNPIKPEFQGLLTINGLIENSAIKITDASMRLVYETLSNGGTATWNLQNPKGQRASTGVYLVFMIPENGNEVFIGKFLLIN
jgi:hypothetical protein